VGEIVNLRLKFMDTRIKPVPALSLELRRNLQASPRKLIA
jgi:hypothetical protein